jgi:hypothetical protein
MKFALSSLTIVTLMFASISCLAVNAENLNWDVSTVDQNGRDGTLILDSNGNPHITYFGSHGLEYATLENNKWRMQTVDSNCGQSLSETAEKRTCLVLDSVGNPHISYCKKTEQDQIILMYGFLNSSNWSIQIVNANVASDRICLVLDSFGKPHLCYWIYHQEQNSGSNSYLIDLIYASWSGSEWINQTVDSKIVPAFPFWYLFPHMSFALESNGNPHVSYTSTGGILMYAYWNGSDWHRQITGQDGQIVSLILDSNQNPIITYYSAYDELKIAHYNCLELRTNSFGKLLDYSQSKYSLLTESNGNLHMTYTSSEGNSHNLNYAFWDSQNWTKRYVGSTGINADDGSLILDQNGNPHIVYSNTKDVIHYTENSGYHSTEYRLMYARVNPNKFSDLFFYTMLMASVIILLILVGLLILRRFKKINDAQPKQGSIL